MVTAEAQRTLVKSAPELWSELSDPQALARHLGELGEIHIVRTKPERSVEWEAGETRGTVEIKPSGWGTKVKLSVTMEATKPPPPVAGALEASGSEQHDPAPAAEPACGSPEPAVAPEEPAVAPPEPAAASEEPAVAPPEPTVASEEPTSSSPHSTAGPERRFRWRLPHRFAALRGRRTRGGSQPGAGPEAAPGRPRSEPGGATNAGALLRPTEDAARIAERDEAVAALLNGIDQRPEAARASTSVLRHGLTFGQSPQAEPSHSRLRGRGPRFAPAGVDAAREPSSPAGSAGAASAVAAASAALAAGAIAAATATTAETATDLQTAADGRSISAEPTAAEPATSDPAATGSESREAPSRALVVEELLAGVLERLGEAHHRPFSRA